MDHNLEPQEDDPTQKEKRRSTGSHALNVQELKNEGEAQTGWFCSGGFKAWHPL